MKLATLRGTRKVRFFSFFSIDTSTLGCVSLAFDGLSTLSWPSEFSSFSSVLFLEPASTVEFNSLVVVLSRVKFFLGTSTHSKYSMTASARSNEMTPLLLSEKCRFALIGDDRFLVEYLENAVQIKVSNLTRYGYQDITPERITKLTSRLHLSGQRPQTWQNCGKKLHVETNGSSHNQERLQNLCCVWWTWRPTHV